jgi:hypothetical protein
MDHLPVCEYYVSRVRLSCELSTLTVEQGGRRQTMGSVVITVGTIADRDAVPPHLWRPIRVNADVTEPSPSRILDGFGGPVCSGFECLDRGCI